MIRVLIVFGLFGLAISIPLLIYHFLMFPNLDGVVQDLSWYNYDEESQHFVYWFGFWFMGIFGFIFGNAFRGSITK